MTDMFTAEQWFGKAQEHFQRAEDEVGIGGNVERGQLHATLAQAAAFMAVMTDELDSEPAKH